MVRFSQAIDGGLDQAVVDVLGGTVAWHSELDPRPASVLAHRYPAVPNLGDITAVDWGTVEPVDVICGGFPCQDISSAGKRAGIGGQRSGLWSHMVDAIGVVRPRYVFVENVAALAVRGLDRVLADLAGLGFDAEWACVRASTVGAPHRRERLFIVAYPSGSGLEGTRAGRHGPEVAEPVSHIRAAPDTDRDAVRVQSVGELRGGGTSVAGRDRAGSTADAGGEVGRPLGNAECGDDPRPDGFRSTEPGGRSSTAADTAGDGWEQGRPEPAGIIGGSDAALGGAVDWGKYAAAIERWAGVLGRPAPAPWQVSERTGNRQLSARFTEWLMGLPDGWVTGVPGMTRNGALHVLGNGVVPAQASYALRLLLARIDLGRVA